MATMYADPARSFALLIEAEDQPAIDEEAHFYQADESDPDA
jgi:lipoprotein NlpI